ncbi:MAG: PaaI family thioesterase [Caulobacterales bacterium]
MDGSEAQTPWALKPVTTGEWAGWSTYGEEPFEDLTGPFFCRQEADGQVVCAFRAERKHMNGGGNMHGGCLMTFADYALFCIAHEALAGTGSVTASMNVEFVDGAQAGELIEARGEVVRAGGSMVFIRGLVTSGGRPLLNFSSIVKKVRSKQGG